MACDWIENMFLQFETMLRYFYLRNLSHKFRKLERFLRCKKSSTRIFIQFRKAVDRTFPPSLSLSFSVLSLLDRVFDTLRQNSPVLSSRPGPRTQERLITVHPLVPPSARRGSVRFSGTRVWKIQFSGHVLRCQLGARWDVWSCESYSAEILFVRLWFGREHGHFGRRVLRVK